jgi:hypothetical protein
MGEKNVNKKGFGLPSIWTVFIVVLMITIFAMAQKGFDSSTINKTIDSLNWSKYNQNITASFDNAIQGANENYMVVILEICKKAIDFFGYSIFAVGKLAMELARDNPNVINWQVLAWLLILSLLAPLIYPAFIIIVSLILITKEWWQVRKEKKALEHRKLARLR